MSNNSKGGGARPLRHVVVFRFQPETPAEKIDEIARAFAALPSKIDGIVDFEWGVNNSPEDLNDGYTHCFVISFENEEARAAYLPHPAHKEFVALLRPYLDKPFVLDYWTQR